MSSSYLKYACGVVAAAAIIGATATPARAQAIVTNGSGLGVGIRETGAMGVSGIRPAEAGRRQAQTGGGLVGLAFVADYGSGLEWRDATTPGCLCEGFGVSANGIAGFDGNGFSGLTVLDAGGTIVNPSRFTTLVALSGLAGVTIAHDYHPSASPNLYEATVTISNTTADTVTDVRYTRVMDWDVPPTEFSEFVTLQGVGLGNLIDSCDDGFESANPLSNCTGILFTNANAVDSGPADHGARFTFGFGDLAAGATKTFNIFYGAAGTEAAALAALGAAGAEGIYSFGQSNGGQRTGGPATFIFGFGGVGAPPIDPTVPEPSTMVLLAGGLATAIGRRYRRSQASR